MKTLLLFILCIIFTIILQPHIHILVFYTICWCLICLAGFGIWDTILKYIPMKKKFIKNPTTTNGRYDNCFFDNYGSDLTTVKLLMGEGYDVISIKLSDEEDKEPDLIEGFYKMNVIGYLIKDR